MQNSLCKATLHDFTIAFQHFTTQTNLRPQGVRGRRNAQVRGRLFGHALPSWPNSPLVAAQHSALLLAAILVVGELPIRDALSVLTYHAVWATLCASPARLLNLSSLSRWTTGTDSV